MDCPACHGNGELDTSRGSEDHRRMEKETLQQETVRTEHDRLVWPYACPVCGGTGYLEQ